MNLLQPGAAEYTSAAQKRQLRGGSAQRLGDGAMLSIEMQALAWHLLRRICLAFSWDSAGPIPPRMMGLDHETIVILFATMAPAPGQI